MYRYSIEINGKEVYQQHNTKPQDFKDVQMWISDGFYGPGKCVLKNIRFENLGKKKILGRINFYKNSFIFSIYCTVLQYFI